MQLEVNVKHVAILSLEAMFAILATLFIAVEAQMSVLSNIVYWILIFGGANMILVLISILLVFASEKPQAIKEDVEHGKEES